MEFYWRFCKYSNENLVKDENCCGYLFFTIWIHSLIPVLVTRTTSRDTYRDKSIVHTCQWFNVWTKLHRIINCNNKSNRNLRSKIWFGQILMRKDINQKFYCHFALKSFANLFLLKNILNKKNVCNVWNCEIFHQKFIGSCISNNYSKIIIIWWRCSSTNFLFAQLILKNINVFIILCLIEISEFRFTQIVSLSKCGCWCFWSIGRISEMQIKWIFEIFAFCV